jgi:UDP-glucose 4-epimerase
MNLYGRTNLAVEDILSDYGTAYGQCSLCLQYLNAPAGGLDLQVGASHHPKTHPISRAFLALSSQLSELTLLSE